MLIFLCNNLENKSSKITDKPTVIVIRYLCPNIIVMGGEKVDVAVNVNLGQSPLICYTMNKFWNVCRF